MAETTPGYSLALAQHRISVSELDRLASGEHDADILSTLRNAEHSRRLLALRLLVHHVRGRPLVTGPLAVIDEPWNLLVGAQKKAPQAVYDILSDPHVGVWCAHALRRLQGKTEDPAPLWFHVGQLHTLACAAAIRAGLRFRMTIPLRDGWVVLPEIGSIELPAMAGWATADVVANKRESYVETRIEPADLDTRQLTSESGWRPQRELLGRHDRVDLVVRLDDVSPYRGLKIPTPAEPLPAAVVARWEALLVEAWDLLQRSHQPRAQELFAGLSTITPRPAGSRFHPHSASVGDGFGAAIIAEPYDAPQLALTMIHELQHSKLNAINHLIPLVHEDPPVGRYSPWRDDPRPTMGLLHGVYAFAAVAEFWAAHCSDAIGQDRELALFESALLRIQLNTALAELGDIQSLTQAGRRFVESIVSRVAGHDAAEIRQNVTDTAKVAALDHRLAWRVSHLRPRQDKVRRAAEAWLRANPATDMEYDVYVQPNASTAKLDGKAMLAKQLIVDPTSSVTARSVVCGGAHINVDEGAADFALVSGDPVKARELYLTELADGSNRPGAWSGLGIAANAIASTRAATVLLRHPEIVSAVHHEVTNISGKSPNPEGLAAWLGPPV